METTTRKTTIGSSRSRVAAHGFGLAFAVLAAIWALPLVAEPAAVSVEPKNVISGTALEVLVTVGEGIETPLDVEVLLDGRALGQQTLQAGENTLEFAEVSPASGGHQLTLRGPNTLTVNQEFRLLPGWLSLVPPLLAIGLALIFRDVLVALFVGIFGGAMILNGWNPLSAFGRSIDHFIVPALADGDHASIIIFTVLLGGMVGLVTKSGGTHGIIERVAPYATDRRRGQLATWFMGLMVFFDDYANTLIVGPTMRPITDKLKISREKLAYIVDSTAAPVVCLFPISTWVGFEIGLIGDAFSKIEGLDYDPYTTFVQTIPYRFYPLFALTLVLVLILSRRDFGPMRAAEKRAYERGELLPPGAKPIADYASNEVEPGEDVPKRAMNALLPILTVVMVTVIGLYVSGLSGLERSASTGTLDWMREVFGNANSFHALLWASLAGVLVALILPLSQGILKVSDGMNAMVSGFKSMLLALVVLTLAWSLSSVCSELQTAEFLVSVSSGLLSPAWMPALTFVLAAAIAFATGSSWGTMAILEPLVIPICHNLSVEAGLTVGEGLYPAYLFGTIASVLAGSVWGDHCSPISDTTILSSMATGCDHIAHVRTQIPYALTVGLLGIGIGNIPIAFGLSPWLSLLIGMTVIVLGVHFLGKRQDASTV